MLEGRLHGYDREEDLLRLVQSKDTVWQYFFICT
jgi:hypothetical protein